MSKTPGRIDRVAQRQSQQPSAGGRPALPSHRRIVSETGTQFAIIPNRGGAPASQDPAAQLQRVVHRA